MSVFRHSVLLFVMMVVLLATDPVCLADKQAKIPKFEPPVQNYAVIDISGTKATSPVTMIALNDDNHAAFGFGTGDAVPNVASYTTYQVYTWSNGTSTPLEPIAWVHFGGYDSISHTSSWSVANPEWLTPSGAVYANGFNVDVFDNGGEMRFSADMIGCPDLPNPPYGTSSNSHGTQYYRNWISCVSDRGYVGGGGVSSLPDGSQPWGCYYGFIKDLDDKFTLFRDADSIAYGWSNEPRPVEGKVIVNANTFYPAVVNNQGQSVGAVDSSRIWVFWNGTSMTTTGKGERPGLNDQGQVILQDASGDSPANYEGGFWESGQTTILRDKLPIWFQPQDWNIQPTAISNQVKPVPQFPGDSTLNILADADGIDVGAYRKTLWTRDNNGKWSFANVALPEGTTIDGFGPINSSGVIVAIGNGGHALLLVPVETKFMKPDVPTWNDSDELPVSRVILFDEKTRIRMRISIKFNNLAQITAIPELLKLKIKASSTKPDGAEIVMAESNCVFVAGTNYSEIRIEQTREQLKTLGCIPQNEEDGVDEQSWYDVGDNDSSSEHNLTDGKAFDTWGYPTYRSDKKRGHCTQFGDLNSNPPNSPLVKPEKSFLKAAGVELITAEFGGARSQKRQIANQADTFYFSGHGFHYTGQLSGDQTTNFSFTFGPDEAIWNKELKIAIIAGCSVLDIKDFRAKSFGWMSRLDVIKHGGLTSPGEKWESIGPKYFLGYCWKAPLDNDGTPISMNVISSYLAGRSLQIDPITAWMSANNPTSPIYSGCINACAIDASKTPHEYWYWDETSGHPIWTRIIKGVNGW